ncbi:MAG: glycine dehydrogenase (aminomethyl-transferring), partial [Planctomycetia bacterium]
MSDLLTADRAAPAPPADRPAVPPLAALENPGEFEARHVGLSPADERHMLDAVGAASRAALVAEIVPAVIARRDRMDLPAAATEAAALAELRSIAGRNRLLTSFIGQGYHGTHTPGVILRNILENPAWYTAYTPYQAEIAQGRMEALVNFQTMVCDLTAMPIANASLLDEATAAAEAMTLARRTAGSKSDVFLADRRCHPQSLEVLATRAKPLGIEVVVGDVAELIDRTDCFGVLVQYPATDGTIDDFRGLAERVHARGAALCVATDLLALTLLTPPGEWGADIVV